MDNILTAPEFPMSLLLFMSLGVYLIAFRINQSADPANAGKFMVFKSNPVARWFDDYRHAVTVFKPKKMWMF